MPLTDMVDADLYIPLLKKAQKITGFDWNGFFKKNPYFNTTKNIFYGPSRLTIKKDSAKKIIECIRYIYLFFYTTNRKGLDHRQKYKEFKDFFNCSDRQAMNCFCTDNPADIDGGFIYLEKKFKEILECFPN